MKIKEIMSAPAIVCRPSDMLHTAAHLMWQQDCGALPVVNDQGRVVGMITDRDVCMSAYMQGAPLSTIPVSRAMATQVFSGHADDTLDAAERLMAEKKIRRIPIVDDAGCPLGVLSLNDIARHATSRSRNGQEHKLTQTLASICQPRGSSRPAGNRVSA